MSVYIANRTNSLTLKHRTYSSDKMIYFSIMAAAIQNGSRFSSKYELFSISEVELQFKLQMSLIH